MRLSVANITDDQVELSKRLKRIQTKEIVLGLAGPLGSQLKATEEEIGEIFSLNGYQVHIIKISDLISLLFNSLPQEDFKSFCKEYDYPELERPIDPGDDQYARVLLLQDMGNYLRDKFEHNVLGQSAVREILLYRIKAAEGEYADLGMEEGTGMSLTDFAVTSYKPKKTAYIINQLKNPAEINLLRTVYSSIFYLLGVIERKQDRVKNVEEMIQSHHPSDYKIKAVEITERDRSQDEKHGQQLEKTLQLADYFIYKAELDREAIRSQAERFLDLVHGQGINTPTNDEYGMYTAYSAGLSSACLSRQVGASILNKEGSIVSTGCNDVPKFGGGLYGYSPEDGGKDKRCYRLGEGCHNDKHKNQIKSRIRRMLKSEGSSVSDDLIEKVIETSGIKDLIEFSRAVHAEMDAIITAARTGSGSVLHGTLYSTTFPCHNCARHIVASGILKVVYIEPYEKSLALILHKDTISLESNEDEKVVFDHFSGVSPRRYQSFFSIHHPRKSDDGLYVSSQPYEHRSPEYLESYRDLELKVQKHLTDFVPDYEDQ